MASSNKNQLEKSACIFSMKVLRWRTEYLLFFTNELMHNKLIVSINVFCNNILLRYIRVFGNVLML